MRAAILSLSPIDNDPRVLRQIAALKNMGAEVLAFGYGRTDLDGGLVRFPQPRPGLANRVAMLMRQGPALLHHGLALPAYWRVQTHRAMLGRVLDFRPDIIHVNDWPCLPVGARAAERLGVPFLYDSHEFALGEQEERLLWRLVFRPYIAAIERPLIRRAAAVITVGEKLADILREVHGLPETPTVIRNVPTYEAIPFRPTGSNIRILYHGVFNPNRGLEAVIRSVPLWAPPYTLTLRGVGNPGYLDSLKELVQELGIQARVEFAPAVLATELIRHAATADVGIFLAPVDTPQSRYCLPNKLFEYAMAGLAQCVSHAEEMARLVEHFHMGVIINGEDPGAIAESINALTPTRLDTLRRNALEAARQLCWEHEQEHLLAVYRRVLTGWTTSPHGHDRHGHRP